MIPRELWSEFERRQRALRGSAENVHFGCNEGKGWGRWLLGQGSLRFAWKVLKTSGFAKGRRGGVWEGAETYRGSESCEGPMAESWQGFCLLSYKGAVFQSG